MNFKFYEVDSKYIKYLKENGDEKIPNIDYKKHKKFSVELYLQLITLIILHQYLLITKKHILLS